MRRAARAPRAGLGTVLGLVLGAVLTGCGVGMPTSGAIHDAGPAQAASGAPGIAIDPRPPQPDASVTQIVQGFLDAMLATPTQTRTAQLYLSQDAQAAWNPGLSTITYDDKSPPRGTGPVTVDLVSADQLNASGAWEGQLSAAASRLTFPMVREGGQWRIAAVPNALIVPKSWFESRYSHENLYWFDQTGRVLVPEPVFVPRGTQLATSLVRDLVQGPSPELAGTARSFLPQGVGEGLSVPVSPDGTAEIALTGGAQAPSTPQALTLLRAQLAWTLRQDPTIHQIRLSIGGRDVQMTDGRAQFSVQDGSEYDPSGYQTYPRLFALRRGLLVSGQPDEMQPVGGPFGMASHSIGSFSVSLWADTVAAVSGDGRSLLVGPLRTAGAVRPVVRGAASLLRPAWDAQRHLWVVDARPTGASVSYFDSEMHRHRVDVPGVSGAAVSRFLVSRDGTRFVAVVRTATGDRVVASMLRAADDGSVVGATPAVQISSPDDSTAGIQDIAWSSPTDVLLLHRFTTSSQIRTISVDGSGAGFPSSPITVGDLVDALVSSSPAALPQYVRSGQRLLALSPTARDATLADTLDELTYVG